MASGGIKIPFIADVANFLRGTKDVEDALDDVADSLDDVAKAGAQAGDKAGADLADGITDGAKDADAALGKLEKDFKGLADAGKASKKAGDDLGHNVSKGAHQADEGIKSFKQNTASNLRETTASIHSVGDAIGGIQGLASEALEGFGPLGAIAGAALAAGIGLGVAKFQAQSERLKESIKGLSSALVEGGGRITQDSIFAKVKSFVDEGKINELSKQADKAHVNVSDFLLALGGDPAALKRATDQLEEYRTSVNLTAEGTNEFKDEGAIAEVDKQLREQAKAMGIAVEAYGHYDDAAGKAEAQAKALADQQAASTAAQEEYTATLLDAADPLDSYSDILDAKTTAEQKAAQATADATKSTKDTWETYANDVVVTIDDMIHDLNAKAANRKEFEHNLRLLASKGGGALVAELRAKGPEAAGATVDMLAHAKSAKVKALATAYGKETGAAAGKGVADGVTGRTDDVTLSLNRALRTATRATAEDFKQNPPEVPVKAKVDTRGADATIKALAQTVTVTLDYRLGKQKP